MRGCISMSSKFISSTTYSGAHLVTIAAPFNCFKVELKDVVPSSNFCKFY